MKDILWKTAQQLLITVNMLRKPSIPIYCQLTKRNENIHIGRVITECPLQFLHNFKLKTTFNYQELKDKQITFEFKGIDKYNRALGYIYANNKNVNKRMLTTSYCHPYEKMTKDQFNISGNYLFDLC